MIAAYPDINGCVGDPDDLPPHAEDVLAGANELARQVYDAGLLIKCIASRANGLGEAVHEDPHGYTHHHVAAWRAIEKQMVVVQDALSALKKLVDAA